MFIGSVDDAMLMLLMVEQVNHTIGKIRSIVWRPGNFRKLKGKVRVIDEPEEARGFWRAVRGLSAR